MTTALTRRRTKVALTAALVPVLLTAACSRGSDTGASSPAGSGDSSSAAAGSCPDVLAKAKTAVDAARDTSPKWTGPTSGPPAQAGKTIVYVAADLTNPGVKGVADAVQEAGAAIGWQVRVLDGQGTPAGQQSAFSQALALNPAGLVVGGFDPKTTQAQLDQANSSGTIVVGWHAVGAPGPSNDPKMFTNVTTKVDDVAEISAQWIIADSNGTGGVVVFTDASIPFAKGKSDSIVTDLQACSSIKVLTTENIPIPDAAARTPQEVSTLIGQYADQWTYSVAINDLYFDNAAPSLRAAGKDGKGAPFNVGAGDGSSAAFQRIRSGEYQAATVPEPLSEQGWQIVDELNRGIAGQPATDYYAPVHVTDTTNPESGSIYDPQSGYRDIYKGIWASGGS